MAWALCALLITKKGFLITSWQGGKRAHLNIVTLFFAPLLRSTVTSLFLRKQKLRKALSCCVLIKDQHLWKDGGGSSTGQRERSNWFRPDKFGQPHEDIWNEYVLLALSYTEIGCVDPSLDMGHTNKAWPWVSSSVQLSQTQTHMPVTVTRPFKRNLGGILYLQPYI